MTRSRKAAPSVRSAADARAEAKAALPSLAGYWTEDDINSWNDDLLRDLEEAASMAKGPHGQNQLRIVAVAARAGTIAEQAKIWLGLAFHRIEALERELKSAKRLQRKSLDNRFSLDDLDVEQIDDRNIKIGLVRGEDEASFTVKFPVVVDRGVWNERAIYERGDGVSHSGSWWIARDDNPGKPGAGDGWRLAVKRAGSARGAEK